MPIDLSMSKTQLLLELAREVGAIAAKDVEAKGIHRQYLKRLEQLGLLIRSGRGVYMSGQALEAGIETHSIEGVPVRVYCLAKTVADCFKYRNKIGLDVALEALRSCWQQRRCTMDELWHYAKICRVQNVIRPYLESLG